MPSAFLIEPGGPLVADRARQPCRFDAIRPKPELGVSDESCGDAGTAGLRRDKQLIELVAFEDRESYRHACGVDDTDIGKRGAKTVAETLQGAESRESRRHDLRVRFVPAIEPYLRQLIEVAFVGGSYLHFKTYLINPIRVVRVIRGPSRIGARRWGRSVPRGAPG